MYAIVAVDEKWGIGRDNGLLFRLPADLKRFRSLTEGHTVLMGRKTLESLPGGRGLPRRRNIVLTGRRAGGTAARCPGRCPIFHPRQRWRTWHPP